jgi:uncharacterized membrane protein
MQETPPSTTRVEAFSDGVIAIIITIMVLELRLPAHAGADGLWHGLLQPLLPKLISYLASFVVIAVMWLNHHQLLHAAGGATRGLLWANIHLLLWMSLIPISTGFIGEHPFMPLAVAVYGFVLCANSCAFMLLRWCVRQDIGDRVAFRRIHARVLWKNVLAVALYAVTVPLAFVSVYASLAIFALILVLFVLPESLPGPREAKAKVTKKK